MNDSGKWMYYENGKALTGKQTISGISYTFNSYGETNDTPRDLRYGTHTVVENESWWSIARKYNCSMFELARINNNTIFTYFMTGRREKKQNGNSEHIVKELLRRAATFYCQHFGYETYLGPDLELTALFKRLYEDNVLGRIPDEHYRIRRTA